MVEEQVHEELAVAARDRHLGADEREPGAELAQEPGEVVGERLGQITLPDGVHGEEVEDERVLDDFPDRFSVRLWDGVVEGSERGLRPFVQSAGDHGPQDGACPGLGNSPLSIEVGDLGIRTTVEQGRHQAPRQSGNGALPNSGGPTGGQRCHVAQVPRRQSVCTRVRRPQVRGQALGHLRTPALLLFPRDDVPANHPEGLNDDVVDCPGSAELPSREGPLDRVEQLVVLGGGSN